MSVDALTTFIFVSKTHLDIIGLSYFDPLTTVECIHLTSSEIYDCISELLTKRSPTCFQTVVYLKIATIVAVVLHIADL